MADTDSLDWVRLDTNMPMNPKILRLISQPNGAAAAFAWVCSITHSGLVASSGYIPDEALPFIHCKKSAANLLVKERLWTRHADNAGYVINDYEKYNQTKETTQVIRLTKKIGGIKGNHAKHKHEESGVACDCLAKIAALEKQLPEGYATLA